LIIRLFILSGKKSGKPSILLRRSDHLFASLHTVSKYYFKISKKFDGSLSDCILSSLNSDNVYIAKLAFTLRVLTPPVFGASYQKYRYKPK